MTSLSTYDFSTLYNTLPHNLFGDKLIDLIERTFQKECYPYIPCNEINAFYYFRRTKMISGMVMSKCMRCADLFV